MGDGASDSVANYTKSSASYFTSSFSVRSVELHPNNEENNKRTTDVAHQKKGKTKNAQTGQDSARR